MASASGQFSRASPPHFPGYLRVSANPFISRLQGVVHSSSHFFSVAPLTSSRPFPAPFSLPLPYRVRDAELPARLLAPIPASPLPPSTKSGVPSVPESLEDLKLKSLQALLPVLVAFLCTFEAGRNDATGVSVADIHCEFNDTFGRLSGIDGCMLDVPFLFKEDVVAVVGLLGSAYEAAVATKNKVRAPTSFLKLKRKQNEAGDVEGYATQVPNCLVGYVIGRKGESVKRIYAETGVELLIVQKEQWPSKRNYMANVQMRFGDMPDCDRLQAAHSVLEKLRRMFVKLYCAFPERKLLVF